VALAAAGCGGDDTKEANAYVAATDQAVTTFEGTFKSLQSDFTATSTPEQDVKTLDRFGAAVQTTVQSLRAIRPPTEVSALHQRLVAAVESYQAVIEKARTGFTAVNTRTVIAARTRFSEALTEVTTKISAQIEAINRKLQA
jgi:hypothetical protein